MGLLRVWAPESLDREVSVDTIGRLMGRGHNSGKRLYSLLTTVACPPSITAVPSTSPPPMPRLSRQGFAFDSGCLSIATETRPIRNSQPIVYLIGVHLVGMCLIDVYTM